MHNEGLQTCGPHVVDGVRRVLDFDQQVLYEGEIHACTMRDYKPADHVLRWGQAGTGL